ncbi:hypothetical protein NDU88_001259 [Pleurodeles waltl]|uniref:Uncharacterized protein n=1 Tax=Pleurodeles waltl TaxID=8319 RepID=A0AAV7LKV6_PLEWA|nr:hypothetical protein NDU88_001259 [Pleurodeles waltl]
MWVRIAVAEFRGRGGVLAVFCTAKLGLYLDPDERFVTLHGSLDAYGFCLINVYVPNVDNATFMAHGCGL